VKLVRSRLVIDRPKPSKTRVVPQPDSVAFELAEHLGTRQAIGEDFVFTSQAHDPLDRNYFSHGIWHRAPVEAGIEPGRDDGMHALRHFYAAVLIDAGESVKPVAEYLVHADPGFTLRPYATPCPAASSAHDMRSRLPSAPEPAEPRPDASRVCLTV
jgi:site-specific recombinase XerD